MVRPQLIKEEQITMPSLKHELDEIKKRDKELGYRAAKTDEYLGHFVKITQKQAEELKKKLESLNIPRLKDSLLIKIIDIMPVTVDELKTILQSYVVNISKQDMEAIVAAVAEFAPKKK
jgi:DNA-directed RNA polymerase subunit F